MSHVVYYQYKFVQNYMPNYVTMHSSPKDGCRVQGEEKSMPPTQSKALILITSTFNNLMTPCCTHTTDLIFWEYNQVLSHDSTIPITLPT